MKKLLFTLTLILTCLNLFAEIPEDKAAVSGKVTDAKTGAPVEYATVALYNQANDALVTGTITMPDGKFKIDGIKLSFNDDALDFIVDKAIEFKLGARGLRSICEAIMLDVMFEYPSKKVKTLTIDKLFAESYFSKTELNHTLKA